MMENSAENTVFRYRGSTFDSMIESLGAVFGTFDADLVGRTRDFYWALDLAGCENATLITGHHQTGFQFRAQWCSEATEHLSIVVPRRGGMGVTYGSRMAEAREEKLLLYRNFELDSISIQGQSNLIDELVLNWSLIQRTIGETFDIPFSGSLDLLPEVDLSTPVGRTIGNLTEAIIDGIRDNGPLCQSPIATAHITQALADVVIRMVPHRLSHLLDKKPHMIAPGHVRRGIEFMCANVNQPITMPMVADAAGVSTRALEAGFRAFKNTTPAAYLQMLRLRAAREDLLDPENRMLMKEICLKWGFFQFGRFAAVYRAHYGENPSETRRRVCGSNSRRSF
ncbi:AraC family transcriptional regulator [Rhizobium altiplani]|uniref:AraC family transcriptional regulator n=1 Tax=Rhizobium altiplani TaxID=1864509 RepID=A0A109JT74_9HYPH|nr:MULTISPECIES: helix-turn-helix transcriptional regulator [Rhizobium]KWV40939.1 AraC family transcriptional regulator [Rhizobium altiplani]KWV48006.1 AraC family transcriptional regulator [Rhizobium altiplani]KWV48061.1 AraC family transcriptional regulator [Rhizobium altiplani]KWV54594.1 AraC family transcriptional regulator [Rhizobium altiplani]MDQ0561087.1 AraC-like DNA-binding protein [Rhizobium mesoamericanum]